jgi:hypothetical protein
MAANSGVSVNLPAGADADKLAKNLTTPEAAASQILDALEHNAYRVVIGRDARLMDLFYRINPSGAAALIARQMKSLLS